MARGPKPNKKKAKKKAPQEAGAASSSGAGMDVDGEAPPQQPRIFRPGIDAMEEGETLEFDPSAYDCMHAFRVHWPCLSFDVLRDNLGAHRTAFPHTQYLVAGTQAETAARNALVLLKVANVTRIKQRSKPAAPTGEDEEEEEDEDDSSSDEEDEGGPVLQVRAIAHHGGVNRVRSMGQQPHVVASWAETGHVQVWDVTAHLNSLVAEAVDLQQERPEGGEAGGATVVKEPPMLRQAPLQIFTGHSTEGFALDWSPVTTGRLVTGDCAHKICLWEPQEGGKWAVDKKGFTGHTKSVEDLQWSPTEATVFASCSVDQTIKVWDTRNSGTPALSVKAHADDINVISWNRVATCMLASGCDDGTFRIWDLRNFKPEAFVAHFKYHKAAISAIEWSPIESSVLATTCADNQLSIWDVAVERDLEEEALLQEGNVQLPPVNELPPQLMFVHMGQNNLKELHWHPQIPGMITSTAEDGFNVFKAANI